MRRPEIPTAVTRAVLIEAGHRCAIPTCQATPVEIAHIMPFAKTQDDAFENLIALCPTCHTRYDQKKEIDLLSMKQYKLNLSLLNNRLSRHRASASNEKYILPGSLRLIRDAAGLVIGQRYIVADAAGNTECHSADDFPAC